MSMLPPLDTLSIDLSLPLSWQQADLACWPSLRQECWMMLQALQTENTDPEDDTRQTAMQARLDLLLWLTLQQRYPAAPAITACRLGLEQIAWLQAGFTPPGSNGILQLHLPACLPLLRLPARLDSCDAGSDGYICVASLMPWPEGQSWQNWEKWIFRQHRQHLTGRNKTS